MRFKRFKNKYYCFLILPPHRPGVCQSISLSSFSQWKKNAYYWRTRRRHMHRGMGGCVESAIQKLQNDIFVNNLKLEACISINKIKFIGTGLFTGLKKLKSNDFKSFKIVWNLKSTDCRMVSSLIIFILETWI